jgi:uncharacterized protein YbbC (DUF1343 family)
MGGQVNTWKLNLNPSNGKYLVYKRQASHPMHLTIHTGKLYMYVTEGVNIKIEDPTSFYALQSCKDLIKTLLILYFNKLQWLLY